MRTLLLGILLLGCVAGNAQKQGNIRLNLYGNYVFDDSFDSYYSATSFYSGKIKGGFQYGLGIEFMPQPVVGVELSWQRFDTKAPTSYYDPNSFQNPKSNEFGVVFNYIMLGFNRYMMANEHVEGFLGGQLGVGVVDVSNLPKGGSGSTTKFAWGLRGGTNIWFSHAAGIKLQAALQSVAQGAGGGLYFGTGGAGVGVSTYSTVLQFTLGGGLVFRFGGK